MKTMMAWSLKPGGGFNKAVRRSLAGEGNPLEGVKMLGRWHSVDFSVSFTLYESDNMTALDAETARWADILDLKNYIVIEDSQAGPVLAGLKKSP